MPTLVEQINLFRALLKEWWPVLPVLFLGLTAFAVVRLSRKRPRRTVKQGNVVRIGKRVLRLSNAQHQGARHAQEDAFAFSNPADQRIIDAVGVVGVVADGMGGLIQGANASRIAVKTFLQDLEISAHCATSVPEALSHAVEAANNAVVALAQSAGVQVGYIGSTLAAVSVSPVGLHWIAVGDTRIYVFHSGRLWQVNVDHTPERELARAPNSNGVTGIDAHVVTSYLGLLEIPAIDRSQSPYQLHRGDQVLVCSDGLYGSLGKDNLLQLLASSSGRDAELFVHHALSRGRIDQDNLTIIAIACD